MWLHKTLDIGWSDLLQALARPSFALNEKELYESIAGRWPRTRNTFVCLSVRTGFDLLLSALGLPERSEMIICAINIPHMFRIVADHGLKAVPVDIRPDTLGPDLRELETKITSNTRAIVVTHLLGARAPVEAVRDIINGRDIFLIEDSSQYFPGPGEDTPADARMYSFGTIKTATALGGAVITLKSRELFERMSELHSRYPAQSEPAFRRKALKCLALKLATDPLALGAISFLCRAAGVDMDVFIYESTKSFTGGDFYEKIRLRPSRSLLRLLDARLENFSIASIEAHASECRRLAETLGARFEVPGIAATDNVFWVFPFLSCAMKRNAWFFRDRGFFVSARHGICCIDAPEGEVPNARALLDRIVYIPFHPGMPAREKTRLVDLLVSFFEKAGRTE